MSEKQHDAHCRARRRLARRVLNRRYDWGLGYTGLRGLNDNQLMAAATAAIAAYSRRHGAWSEGWGERQLGRYHCIGGYDGPKVPYKDVPGHVVHSIMCLMEPPRNAKE